MKIFNSKSELSGYLENLKKNHQTVGLVPTMGALHQGHLSLIRESLLNCDITVASIFVNPTQFNNQEDLLKYPKPLEQDMQMLENAGCDILFHPDVEEMYTANEQWDYEVGPLDHLLEGEFRPGHYKGVTQIVHKLFTITNPDFAFFGQKDYQQFLVIQKMVTAFDLNVKLKLCPIIREEDGLAMSSRNVRLSAVERKKAVVLYHSLLYIKNHFLTASNNLLLKEARKFYHEDETLELEYLKVCDKTSLLEKNSDDKHNAIVLVACNVGQTRLIDNMMLS